MEPTKKGGGPNLLKTTRGFRHVVGARWKLENHLRRSKCTCPEGWQEDGELRHAKGCPVHLAWTAVPPHELGEVVGLASTELKMLAMAANGTLTYNVRQQSGGRPRVYDPGQLRERGMLGALNSRTRFRATERYPDGLADPATCSRGRRKLQAARCINPGVYYGRRIYRVIQKGMGFMSWVSVEQWVLDRPVDHVLHLALPGDLLYPEPTASNPLRSGGGEAANDEARDAERHRNVEEDLSVSFVDLEGRRTVPLQTDLATPPRFGGETGEWCHANCLDLLVWVSCMPWFDRFARKEESGRHALQWLYGECERWHRQGFDRRRVMRALAALIPYAAKPEEPRKGWPALICDAVKDGYTPNKADYHATDEAWQLGLSAIAAVRRVMEAEDSDAAVLGLSDWERDGYNAWRRASETSRPRRGCSADMSSN